MILKYSGWNSIYEQNREDDSLTRFTFNFCSHTIFPKSPEYLSQVFLKGVREYFPDAKYISSSGTVYNIIIPIGVEELDDLSQTISIDFAKFQRSLVEYNGRTYPEPIVQKLKAFTKRVIDPEFCNFLIELTSKISKDDLISKIVEKLQSRHKNIKEDLYYLILMKAAGISDESEESLFYFQIIENGIALDSVEKLRSIEIKEERKVFSEVEKEALTEFPNLIAELSAAADRELGEAELVSLTQRVAAFVYSLYQLTKFSTNEIGRTDSQFDKLYIKLTRELTDPITKSGLGKRVKAEMDRLRNIKE